MLGKFFVYCAMKDPIINHDENREAEVQKLCKEILSFSAEHDGCDNSYDTEHWFCPFCISKNYESSRLSKFNHDIGCAYLIAKDLSTNK